jgi:Fur family ferric uptake transcriptional regulator
LVHDVATASAIDPQLRLGRNWRHGQERLMTRARAVTPLDATDSEGAMAMLRERGYRISAARRLVIEALYETRTPASAERIAAGLDGQLPASDLASVYRNLETLERSGLVRHFHAGHGPGLYALATREGGEYLVCEVCGRVIDADPCDLEPVRALIRERFGFGARFSHFPIVGLCDQCGREADPDDVNRSSQGGSG